jgi:hypothetical protein
MPKKSSSTIEKPSNEGTGEAEGITKLGKYDDDELLAHLGKRPQFRRNLGFLSALGLGSSLCE